MNFTVFLYSTGIIASLLTTSCWSDTDYFPVVFGSGRTTHCSFSISWHCGCCRNAFWLLQKNKRHNSKYCKFGCLCVQNSLVQFGAVPDHVPLAKQWRVGEPVSRYPSIHEYTMEWEKVVPSTREIRPWVGVVGLLQCTAARQGTNKSEVRGVE